MDYMIDKKYKQEMSTDFLVPNMNFLGVDHVFPKSLSF